MGSKDKTPSLLKIIHDILIWLVTKELYIRSGHPLKRFSLRPVPNKDQWLLHSGKSLNY